MITFFAPASRCLAARLPLGEDPGRLDHHVDAQVLPRQRRRVPHRQTLEPLAVDHDVLVGRRHVIGQPTQDRVVLQQVRQRLVVGDVVHRHDLDVRRPRRILRVHRPPEVAADPPEPVHAHSHGHACSSLPRSSRSSRSAGAAVPVDALGTGVAPSRSPYPPAPTLRRSRRPATGRGPLRGDQRPLPGRCLAASHTLCGVAPGRTGAPAQQVRRPIRVRQDEQPVRGRSHPFGTGGGNGGLTCDDETVRDRTAQDGPPTGPTTTRRRART